MKKKKPVSNGKKSHKHSSSVSFDTMHFDFEDLLELDEEKEFLRPDADEVEDAPEDEPEEDPIEDLTESPIAEKYASSGKRHKAERSGEEEDLLTDAQVLEYTQEIGKIPEGIEDLDEEDAPEEPEEYDAYEDRGRRRSADFEDDDENEEDDEYYDEEDEEDDGDYDEDDDEDEEDDRPSRRRFSLNAFEMVAVIMSVVLVAAAISLVMLFARTRKQNERMAAFYAIGGQMEGVRIIGESGLIAMRDAAALRLAEASMEEPEEEEIEEEIVVEEPEVTAEVIPVDLTLTTIKKDIKIKFINADTEKLIASVPFAVTVKDPNGKESDWSDDDKDGVIHKTDVGAGTWSVTLKPLSDEYTGKYTVSDKTKTVKVKETIEYKKVDVSNEIKKESQVNIAAEDTEPKAAATVESENKDTVEWVESRREEVGEEEGYEYTETGKDTIQAPAIASLNPLRRIRLGRGAAAGSIIELTEGQTTEMDLAQIVANLGESCTATSGDGGIATVEAVSGTRVTLKGVKAGDTKLTVTGSENGLTDYVVVSVKAAESPSADPGSGSGATDAATAATTDASTGASSTGSAGSTESGNTASVAGSTQTSTGSTGSSAGSSSGATAASTGATAATAASVKKLLEVSPSKISVLVGSTQSLMVTTEGLQDATVIYSSSDESIATVSDKGIIKGVKAGNVRITVTSREDKNLTGSTEVTVTAGKTLKNKNGDTIYIKDGKGYKEATEADYYTETKFYTRTARKKYIYYGWQTLDGHTYYFDKNGNPVTGEQVIQGVKYRFDEEGMLANGSGVLGIDVSRWNGSIDWNAVKNSGVNYAIIRCGFRGTATGALVEDSSFHTNIRGAQKAGLKVGVYFFSAAVNDVEAVEEASMAASLCSGYNLSYPIFLDVERSDSGNGRADGISTSDRTAVIKAFCATVQDSGYKAGLYANKTWMEEKIETPSLTGYKLWLAQYAAEPTYGRTRYDMWQYTSKGTIAGISGKVDLNLSYLNY